MRKIWMSGITHFFYRRPSVRDRPDTSFQMAPSFPRLPVNHYQVRMSRCSHCGVSRNGLFLFSGRLSLKAKVEQVTRTKWTRHRICPEKVNQPKHGPQTYPVLSPLPERMGSAAVETMPIWRFKSTFTQLFNKIPKLKMMSEWDLKGSLHLSLLSSSVFSGMMTTRQMCAALAIDLTPALLAASTLQPC